MGWRETLDSLYKNRDWQAASADERSRAISDVIQISAFGSAAVNVTPIPLADIVVAMPLQAAMVVAIGHIKGRDISKEQSLKIARELSTVVGTHLLARQAFIALSRLVFPGMAGFLMAPWAFGVTYGMGRVAELYFEDPNAPGDALKARFKVGLKDARSVFSKDAFMEFMNRKGADAKEYVDAEKDPAEPAAPAQPAEPQKVVEAEWEDDGEDAAVSTLTYRVIYGDVDLMGFMYYANYLRLFEAGRNEYCRDHGVTYKEIEAAGFFFPVIEAHAKYVRPARYDDLLTLKTWICRRTRVRLEFSFELLRDSELVATGNTVHACLGKNGRPQRLPQGWEERFPVVETPGAKESVSDG